MIAHTISQTSTNLRRAICKHPWWFDVMHDGKRWRIRLRDGLRFHDLRHTHATRLDDLGFSLAKIGAQLADTLRPLLH